MRVLVVIPTLNEAAHLEAVVNDVLGHGSDTGAIRVVIADGGSTDDTVALAEQLALERPAVELLHNSARIQSAAVNLAVRRFGRGFDVLVRCDAHALYPRAFCERLTQTLEKMQADSVVVPLDSRGLVGLQRAIAWVSNSPLGTGGSAHRAGRKSGFVDHGHHAAFRMDMFRQCGGYDETFTHNEDAEFDCRQRALGAKVYLDSTIRVVYHPRSSFAGLFWQYYHYGSGRSRTARRHPGSLRARQVALPVHLAMSTLAVALSPWFTALLAWPAAYLGVLAVAALSWTIRQRSLALLLALPVALVMHTAWASGFLSGLIRRREKPWRREMVTPLQLISSSGARA
jgi:succinoglycan biosynthesis protein ExoA